jgi:putative membrane protein
MRRFPLQFGLLTLALALLPGRALAHNPPLPGQVWQAWNWDVLVLGGLLLMASGYSLGALRLWRRAGPGRGARRRQALCFVGAMLILVVALVSPLDAMGHALFSLHMVQHLLLILGAAPLLVLARPLPMLLWALRGNSGMPGWFKLVGRLPFYLLRWRFFAPLAWILHAAALWLWHMPLLYDAAVAYPWVHALEHLSFFLTAVLFWWALLGPTGAGRLDAGLGVLYTFTMAVQGSILAALMTFAPTAWYSAHGAGAVIWGLAHPDGRPGPEGLFICAPFAPADLAQALLADQQLAGLLMWIPSGGVYLLFALWLLARWLREAEQRAARRMQGTGDRGQGIGHREQGSLNESRQGHTYEF